MGLKSTAHRSANQEGEENGAVLEQNTSDAAAAASRNGEAKALPRTDAPVAFGVTVAGAASSRADEVEALYLEHRNLLLYVACRKFRVPDCDAENLIQEVFLSLMQTGTKIENVRAWLVAAMCNASRHYWRSSGRTESLPEDFNDHSDPVSHGLAEQYTMKMTVRQALEYLQPRCKETLWLH
jgi:RNA polymerase sigma factor (sigma-70 family)